MSRRRRALGLAFVVGVVSVLFGAGCGGDNGRTVAEGTDNGRTVAEGTVKVELGRPLTVRLSAKEAGDQVSGTAEIISDKGGEAFSIEFGVRPRAQRRPDSRRKRFGVEHAGAEGRNGVRCVGQARRAGQNACLVRGCTPGGRL
jgi:hypothetical protein